MSETKTVAQDATQLQTTSVEEAKKKIAYYKSLLPKPKEQTKRTKDRNSENKAGRVRLLNFPTVFKDLRANVLLLPNNVKQSHIEGEIADGIKAVLFTLCSENLHEKAELNFYVDRLPELLTKPATLYKFLTPSQVKTLDGKVWQTCNVVDLIVKGATLTPSLWAKL